MRIIVWLLCLIFSHSQAKISSSIEKNNSSNVDDDKLKHVESNDESESIQPSMHNKNFNMRERIVHLPSVSYGRIWAEMPAAPPFDMPVIQQLHDIRIGYFIPFDVLDSFLMSTGFSIRLDYPLASKLKNGEPSAHALADLTSRFHFINSFSSVKLKVIPNLSVFYSRTNYAARSLVRYGGTYGGDFELDFNTFKIWSFLWPIFGIKYNSYFPFSKYEVQGSLRESPDMFCESGDNSSGCFGNLGPELSSNGAVKSSEIEIKIGLNIAEDYEKGDSKVFVISGIKREVFMALYKKTLSSPNVEETQQMKWNSVRLEWRKDL